MARPLRVSYPGASYHVLNRGNLRGKVFFKKAHYELFLEALEHSIKLYNVSVYGYCLMSNHFHMYLKTHQGNLSRFMQHFLTRFCVSHNRREKRTGHIFHGRFKAHLVEDGRYISELSRYIVSLR